MKKLLIATGMAALLSGCASTGFMQSDWQVETASDKFYGGTSCTVKWHDALSMGYGIRYYPFLTQANNGKSYFGVANNYGAPVGDVLIKVDGNQPIRISYTETPIVDSASGTVPSMPEMPNGSSKQVEQAVMSVRAMQSPYTLASEEKSQHIIEQMKQGEKILLRVIGYGVNSSTQSTDGEYPITAKAKDGMGRCNI